MTSYIATFITGNIAIIVPFVTDERTNNNTAGATGWFNMTSEVISSIEPNCKRRTRYVLDNRTMMTSSNGNIFRVTGHLCGEFTGPGEFPTQRPVTRSFDVFFDLRPNKRLSKQPWCWWFETLSWSIWRNCNDVPVSFKIASLSLG